MKQNNLQNKLGLKDEIAQQQNNIKSKAYSVNLSEDNRVPNFSICNHQADFGQSFSKQQGSFNKKQQSFSSSNQSLAALLSPQQGGRSSYILSNQTSSQPNEQFQQFIYIQNQPPLIHPPQISINSTNHFPQQNSQKINFALSPPSQVISIKNSNQSNKNSNNLKTKSKNLSKNYGPSKQINGNPLLKSHSERSSLERNDGYSLSQQYQTNPFFKGLNQEQEKEQQQQEKQKSINEENSNYYQVREQIINPSQIVEMRQMLPYSLYSRQYSPNNNGIFAQRATNFEQMNSIHSLPNFNLNLSQNGKNNFINENQSMNRIVNNNSDQIWQRCSQQRNQQMEFINEHNEQFFDHNVNTSIYENYTHKLENDDCRVSQTYQQNQQQQQQQQLCQDYSLLPVQNSKLITSSEVTNKNSETQNNDQMNFIEQQLYEIKKHLKDKKSQQSIQISPFNNLQSSAQNISRDQIRNQQLLQQILQTKKQGVNPEIEKDDPTPACDNQIHHLSQINQVTPDEEEDSQQSSTKRRSSFQTQLLEKSGQNGAFSNSNDNNNMNHFSTNSSLQGRKANQKELSTLKEEIRRQVKENESLKEQIEFLQARIKQSEEERNKHEDITKQQQQLIIENFEIIKKQNDESINKQNTLSQELSNSQKQIIDLQSLITSQLSTINQLQTLLKEKGQKQYQFIKQNHLLRKPEAVLLQSLTQQQQATHQMQIELQKKNKKIQELLAIIKNQEEMRGSQQREELMHRQIMVSEETIIQLNQQIENYKAELLQIKQFTSIPMPAIKGIQSTFEQDQYMKTLFSVYHSNCIDFKSKDSSSFSIDSNKLLQELQEKINENGELGIKNDELQEQLTAANIQIQKLQFQLQIKQKSLSDQKLDSNNTSNDKNHSSDSLKSYSTNDNLKKKLKDSEINLQKLKGSKKSLFWNYPSQESEIDTQISHQINNNTLSEEQNNKNQRVNQIDDDQFAIHNNIQSNQEKEGSISDEKNVNNEKDHLSKENALNNSQKRMLQNIQEQEKHKYQIPCSLSENLLSSQSEKSMMAQSMNLEDDSRIKTQKKKEYDVINYLNNMMKFNLQV